MAAVLNDNFVSGWITSTFGRFVFHPFFFLTDQRLVHCSCQGM